jgi:hypothetical protein
MDGLSKPSLNSFIVSAKSNSSKKFYFEAIGTDFMTRTLIKGNSIRVNTLPENLSFKVSNGRSLEVIYFDCRKHGLSPKPQWF